MNPISRFLKKRANGGNQRQRVTSTLRYSLPTWIRGDYTLHNSELIFSAVSRLSNSLSAMPVQLYQETKPISSDLSDLIGCAPNPIMSSCQFFRTMEACRDTYGNCYAMKTIDENLETKRLDVLDPARVEPVLEEQSGELYYRITPKAGDAFFVHNFYVIHIPFLSTNGYVGINPVSVLYNTLSYSEDIQKFSKDQLNKGINAAVVIEAPANMGVDQRETAISDLQTTYKGTGGTILFLESGLSAKTLNLSPVDTKLFEVQKLTRGTVAMVYGIPPHMMGDYSATSFSSQEQQMLEFLSFTMLPIVTAYEQELNRKLLTPDQRKLGQAFRFHMDATLRADSATRADVDQKAIRSSWKTPNEVRAERGLPNIEGGDKALSSRDLTTLEYIVSNPEKGEVN